MGEFDKCYKCTERYPACQDTCPHGVEAKRKHEMRKAKVDKAKAEAYEQRGYINLHYEKERSKRGGTT